MIGQGSESLGSPCEMASTIYAVGALTATFIQAKPLQNLAGLQPRQILVTPLEWAPTVVEELLPRQARVWRQFQVKWISRKSTLWPSPV